MRLWQKRLLVERNELRLKIRKIMDYLEYSENDLLEKQLKYMLLYEDILDKRIRILHDSN